jgi:hypothetical protein
VATMLQTECGPGTSGTVAEPPGGRRAAPALVEPLRGKGWCDRAEQWVALTDRRGCGWCPSGLLARLDGDPGRGILRAGCIDEG